MAVRTEVYGVGRVVQQAVAELQSDRACGASDRTAARGALVAGRGTGAGDSEAPRVVRVGAAARTAPRAGARGVGVERAGRARRGRRPGAAAGGRRGGGGTRAR